MFQWTDQSPVTFQPECWAGPSQADGTLDPFVRPNTFPIDLLTLLYGDSV